jgi:ribosomal protein S18 acetylase RimI-like enzyme
MRNVVMDEETGQKQRALSESIDYTQQSVLEKQQHDLIRVIQAETKHIPLIAPLFDMYRQFYHQPTDLQGAHDFLTQRFGEGDSVIFLAILVEGENNQKACGFTQLYPTFSSVSMKRLWILNDLFVVPEARQQGVGRMLLEYARAFASETHTKGLTLKTAVDNYAAQALYESLGWQRDEDFFSYNLFLHPS